MALAAMLAASAVVPAAARADDLTGRFIEARRVMAGLERTVRAHDAAIGRLKRDRSASRKRAQAADRRLGRLRERRAALRLRVSVAGERLALARAERDAAVAAARQEARARAAREAQALAAAQARTRAALVVDEAASVQRTPSADEVEVLVVGPGVVAWLPVDASLVGAPAVGRQGPITSASAAAAGPTRQQRRVVRQLEREVRDARRALRRADRETRQVQAQRRSLARRAAGARRQAAAVTRTRRSVEGALSARLRSTTRLAQLRAKKQSDVRPGRDGSGFAWPVRGRITQRYGCTGFRLNSRRGSCARFHGGVDIAAPSGTLLRASATGVVSYVGWSPVSHGGHWGRGFIVVIGHAGGFETLYGHLQPIRRVRVGQLVRKGEVIGHVGSTGKSTGPHVHWEVSRGFRSQDPLRS
jgi:murein DD-endopeptidase MepM/ murein hydrolase activator NlpD